MQWTEITTGIEKKKHMYAMTKGEGVEETDPVQAITEFIC